MIIELFIKAIQRIYLQRHNNSNSLLIAI